MTKEEYKERMDKEREADIARNKNIFSLDTDAQAKYEKYYSKDTFPDIQPA